MRDEEELLFKRFLELFRKSENCHYFIFSDFLGLFEQSIFQKAKSTLANPPYTLFGGCDGCERVMVRFGSEEELGYSENFPITCVKISAKSPKFAEKLTHRDYLGSILNLGIDRAKLGDIIIRDCDAYLFAENTIGEFVAENLTRVRHTDVLCSVVQPSLLPKGDLFTTQHINVQAEGERVDAIISKVFSISRSDSSSLFLKGLVYIDGRECTSASYTLKVGQTISVRGYGRFIFRGYRSLSRKGKKNIDIDLYK